MKHFTGWLQCTAIYEKFLIRDGAGEESYGASSSFPCYIEGKTSIVRSAAGEEVVSTERLYIDGEETIAAGITEDDRFTVGGRARPVQFIAKYYDETGTLDYLVVYL